MSSIFSNVAVPGALRSVVILAAGKGTRMGVPWSKPLHPIAGRSMLGWVILAVQEAFGAETVCVVVSRPESDDIREEAARYTSHLIHALQPVAAGTGDAMRVAVEAFRRSPQASALGPDHRLLLLCGDTPLLSSEALCAVALHAESDPGSMALLGFMPPNNHGYGRLDLADGLVQRIVEERDATTEQRSWPWCHAGVLEASWRDWEAALTVLAPNALSGEYYVTDAVAWWAARGGRIHRATGTVEDAMGVNRLDEAAEAERRMQQRLSRYWMGRGVWIERPETVVLHADTDLAAGVRIEPWVVFGAGVKVAESAHVRSFSYLEGATIGPRSVVGPYARLRPGTVLEADVRVGNFTEIKASFVGLGSKIPHLSYIGDASLGVGVNVGAGVITCNYDGRMKHRTSVGSESFIGSNSALVAPVTLGDRSLIGAGSVITQDVPDDHLALTRVPQTMRGRSAPSLKHKEGKK